MGAGENVEQREQSYFKIALDIYIRAILVRVCVHEEEVEPTNLSPY